MLYFFYKKYSEIMWSRKQQEYMHIFMFTIKQITSFLLTFLKKFNILPTRSPYEH